MISDQWPHDAQTPLCESHGDPLWDPIQRLRFHIHEISRLLVGDFPLWVSWELTLLVSKVWLIQGFIVIGPRPFWKNVTRELDVVTQWMERTSPGPLSLHLASVPPVLVSLAPLVPSPWSNCQVTPALLSL